MRRASTNHYRDAYMFHRSEKIIITDRKETGNHFLRLLVKYIIIIFKRVLLPVLIDKTVFEI